MSGMLPEDQAVSLLTDHCVATALYEIPSHALPQGWRDASYEDLTEAGWSEQEIDDIGPCVIDAGGQLRQVEIDVTLPELRRATPQEIAARNAALAAVGLPIPDGGETS